MKKIALSILATAAIVACNKTDTSSTSGTGSAAASASAQPSTVSNVVDKALSFLGGGGPFEGEITMSVTDPNKSPKTITYDVKGTKLRFDSPTEQGPLSGGYAIFDMQAKKMTMVNDAKKTAMVMDVGAMGATPGAPPPGPKPTIEKTGKTETIAGYSCEIWKVTETSGDKADVCVAKGITFPSSMGRHSAGWMSSLDDGFPLRAISMDSAGKEKSHMEVTKIDKKSIDDARFQVPAGYQTVSMDDMMKNLGGLRGMGNFRPPR